MKIFWQPFYKWVLRIGFMVSSWSSDFKNFWKSNQFICLFGKMIY